MNQHNLSSPNNIESDEIDLRELFVAIWRGKWIIIGVTFIFAIGSVLYALSLPNIYKSEALLAPAGEQKAAGLSGQLGGLAALAGVNLGSGSGIDKTTLAVEILKSRNFIVKFIEKHNLLIELMAVKGWNLNSNSLIFDSDVYDVEEKVWIREVAPPNEAEPSMQEAYRVFEQRLDIKQDLTTGMVTLSVEHYSPHISRQWVEWLISEINAEMRERDIKEAERSISYLKEQIGETQVADVKTALFSLIEEQTKTLMLANVRNEYAFKVIDTPIAPEEKSSPKRAFIVLIVTFVAGLLTTIFFLLSNIFSRN